MKRLAKVVTFEKQKDLSILKPLKAEKLKPLALVYTQGCSYGLRDCSSYNCTRSKPIIKRASFDLIVFL